MGILYLHLSWRIRRAAEVEDDGPEEAELEAIVERRFVLLGKLEDLCIGANSNAIEGVKQAVRRLSFCWRGRLLIRELNRPSRISSIFISSPPERRQASTIRTVDSLRSRLRSATKCKLVQQDSSKLRSNDIPKRLRKSRMLLRRQRSRRGVILRCRVGRRGRRRSGRRRMGLRERFRRKLSRALLVRFSFSFPRSLLTAAWIVSTARKLSRLLTDEHFERTISPFVRAIHSEVIDIRHASVILAHCDQFGAVFEQWAKILAQDLKDEAIYGSGAEMVARIIYEAYRDVRSSSSSSSYNC